MNPFFAKSIFIWNVPAIANGNPEAIADLLSLGGYESVMIKAADGPWVFSPNKVSFPTWEGKRNLSPELVKALHERGIQVIGWGFNYGTNVAGEATVAINQINALGLDGWAFDAESRFESQSGASSLAGTLAKTVRAAVNVPLGACGWSFYFNPSKPQYVWHPPTVIQAFMGICDVGIPMNYWSGQGAASAVWTLKTSLEQWDRLTNKPIIPAGRAYTGDGGTADTAGVAGFASEVIRQACEGYTWWVMDQALKLPDVWEQLSRTRSMHYKRTVVSLAEWAQLADGYLVQMGYAGPGIEAGKE